MNINIKEINGEQFVFTPLAQYKAEEKNKANRILNKLSFTDLSITKILVGSINGQNINMTKIAKQGNVSLPTVSKLVEKLEIAGMLESQPMGPKGTAIQILNNEFIALITKM